MLMRQQFSLEQKMYVTGRNMTPKFEGFDAMSGFIFYAFYNTIIGIQSKNDINP